MNARDIFDLGNNWETLSNFYKGLLIGNGGQTYCRLYLDLQDNTLFEDCEASCNTWLHRDDGSLVEIVAHNSFGIDLSQEELEWLEIDGLSDFGYQEWLGEIEEKVEKAIENCKNLDTE